MQHARMLPTRGCCRTTRGCCRTTRACRRAGANGWPICCLQNGSRHSKHTTPVPAHAHPGRTSPRPFAPLTTPLTNCRSRGGKGGEILGCVSRCGCAEEKQTLCASTNQVCAVICRLIGYLVNALERDLGNALELVNGLCQVSW